MNIKALLHIAAERLVSFSDTPYLDAELLLMKTLQTTRASLHTHSEIKLSVPQQQFFEELMMRRLIGEPTAYILNQQAFWTINLRITKDVLIPRPETELIIEIILEKFSSKQSYQIADLGTGSGAIALALAQERPRWHITATDICPIAINIAQENAQQLRLTNVNFFVGNWCCALPATKFSAIVSNPPYIAENDPHLDSLSYEPQRALVSGPEGLDDIRKIIKEAPKYLTENGLLLLEHGFQQSVVITQLLSQSGYQEIMTWYDLAGNERVTGGIFLH